MGDKRQKIIRWIGWLVLWSVVTELVRKLLFGAW